MHILIALSVLLAARTSADTAAETRMVVLDEGTRTAYRVRLGLNISDYTVTSYHIPALENFRDADYDFVEDRLYILKSWKNITSVFVNGTDERHVADLECDSYTVAIDPIEKRVFASLLGICGKPSKMISMATDGSDLQVLAERRHEASHLGVDYWRRYVYWSEYAACSCLHRMRYNGGDVETVRNDLYFKTSPHAIDWRDMVIYGDGSNPDALHKYSLSDGSDSVLARENSFTFQTETVYDPRTSRLFVYNDGSSSYISVYTSSGTFLGKLTWLTLTEDKRKSLRVNPI